MQSKNLVTFSADDNSTIHATAPEVMAARALVASQSKHCC